jgi:hypothetical protein
MRRTTPGDTLASSPVVPWDRDELNQAGLRRVEQIEFEMSAN